MSNTTHSPTLNELIKMARQKVGFTDPATMMGGGGAPPGGDPAAMGGDPMAAMGGGAPPPADPAAGAAPPMAGGGADPFQAIMDKLNTMGAGGGAGAEPIKPKIDVNVEIMQIKNMLALLLDHNGIPVPASAMVATPEKLTAMAQGQNAAGAGAGAGGAPPPSAIPPIEPIQAAAPGMPPGGGGGGKKAHVDDGEAFGPITKAGESMVGLSARSRAIAMIMAGGS